MDSGLLDYGICDMFAAAGLGYRKEEANHNLDNNQRPGIVAANIVDGKSRRFCG